MIKRSRIKLLVKEIRPAAMVKSHAVVARGYHAGTHVIKTKDSAGVTLEQTVGDRVGWW